VLASSASHRPDGAGLLHGKGAAQLFMKRAIENSRRMALILVFVAVEKQESRTSEEGETL